MTTKAVMKGGDKPIGKVFLGVNLGPMDRLELERLARKLADGNRSELVRMMIAQTAASNPRGTKHKTSMSAVTE